MKMPPECVIAELLQYPSRTSDYERCSLNTEVLEVTLNFMPQKIYIFFQILVLCTRMSRPVLMNGGVLLLFTTKLWVTS